MARKNKSSRLRQAVKAARTDVAHLQRLVTANPTAANRAELDKAKGRLISAKRKLNTALGTKTRHKRPEAPRAKLTPEAGFMPKTQQSPGFEFEADPVSLAQSRLYLTPSATPTPKRWRRPGKAMRNALEALAEGPRLLPESVKVNTLSALQRRGWVKVDDMHRWSLTDAGRSALASS